MSGPRLRVAVLGDSIAWGQGAATLEDRLPRRVGRGLEAAGWSVEVSVHAVPGTRSAGLPGQVRQALRGDPDLALVVIGANDLTHRVPAPEASASLRSALRDLREAGVEVVLAPAPDLAIVPHVPVTMRPAVSAASAELRRRQVAVAHEMGARVADEDGATSSAFASDPTLFSADLFHPSSAGYAVIADAVLPTLLAAASELRTRSGPCTRAASRRPSPPAGRPSDASTASGSGR